MEKGPYEEDTFVELLENILADILAGGPSRVIVVVFPPTAEGISYGLPVKKPVCQAGTAEAEETGGIDAAD